MDEVLTRDECELVLRNYFKEKETELTSYTIKPLSDTVEGFIGEHYVLVIEYKDKNQRFFLKVLNGSEVIFKLSESLNAYEKEEFFYNYLQREFRERGIDLSYSPESYLCKPYKIVLEDLSTRGYKSAPKDDFFDLTHCETALRTLAKFHASGIVYEKLCDVRLNVDFPEFFEEKLFNGGNDLPNQWLDCSLIGIISIIDHLDLSNDKKAAMKKGMQAIKDNAFEKIRPKEDDMNTIIHGDLWLNNFLFLYEGEKPVDSILIDYQLLKYGNPAMDVVQFMMSNTRKAFRDMHYDNLLEFYYEALAGCLQENSIDIGEMMTIGRFFSMCDYLKATVKFQVIADRSTTLLSEDCFADAVLNNDSLRLFLFENRDKHITDSFENNNHFREIITEDLLELAELMVLKKIIQ